MVRQALLLTLVLLVANAVSAALPVPDPERHADFLVGDYDPKRPTLLVFKDPFCPYCINAIPKLKTYSDYNVFLFWAPILGARSVRRVDEIMRCNGSVVADPILAAVQQRRSPACGDEIHEQRANENRRVVDAYNIGAVPSYYVGGRRVSAVELESGIKVDRVRGVTMPWHRYEPLRFNAKRDALTRALILPPNISLETAKELVSAHQPEFVFTGDRDLVPQLLGECTGGRPACLAAHATAREEVLLLLGLDGADAVQLIDLDGSVTALSVRSGR